MKLRTYATALAACAAFGTSIFAQANERVIQASFTFNGVKKQINQAVALDLNEVSGFFRPDAACQPFCIAPMQAAAQITTIDEREVINFLSQTVAAGGGLLIDSRTPEARARGYISASVNVPTDLIGSDNPYQAQIMQALGARAFEGSYNFADALPLVIFDDGPTGNDAGAFITTLLEVGYPAEKISYYRGGMLVWTALGLNTEDATS